MKKGLAIYFLLTAALGLFAVQSLTIRDIQYTAHSGSDGTYPSPYYRQPVITEGIVSAVNSGESTYYLVSPEGGLWSGLAVFDPTRFTGLAPEIGDRVRVTAIVDEYFGSTRLVNVRQNIRIARNQPLPEPLSVTAAEVASNEALESVPVRLRRVSLVRELRGQNGLSLADASGDCPVGSGFCDIIQLMRIPSGQTLLTEIRGLVLFSFGEFEVHPRFSSDIVRFRPSNAEQSSWGRIKSYYK